MARFPLLLAYLLVLLGTPVGEAGFRWMHLATAHSAPANRPGAEPEAPGSVFRAAPDHPSSAEDDEALARPDTRGAPGAHEHPHDGRRAARHEHEHTAAHEHGDAPAHPHAGTPAHPERPATGEPVGASVAPGEPHEHGGKIHTHRQHPAPDAELTAGALSKYYLSPPATPAPAPAAAARHARHAAPALHETAARIDTPPPRLPG
jgi:hypothetical protein